MEVIFRTDAFKLYFEALFLDYGLLNYEVVSYFGEPAVNSRKIERDKLYTFDRVRAGAINFIGASNSDTDVQNGIRVSMPHYDKKQINTSLRDKRESGYEKSWWQEESRADVPETLVKKIDRLYRENIEPWINKIETTPRKDAFKLSSTNRGRFEQAFVGMLCGISPFPCDCLLEDLLGIIKPVVGRIKPYQEAIQELHDRCVKNAFNLK